MSKSDQFTELYEAAKNLLASAIDLGEVFVDDHLADGIHFAEYPRDENGKVWFEDWWSLKCAVDACDKLLEDGDA